MKHIKDRKIRFGIIGGGRVTHCHINALLQYHDDAQIVAICDNNKNVSRNLAEKVGATYYDNAEIMLKSELLDVACIATPNGLHPKHVMMAADYGLHAITEKPMAISLEEGELMNAYCKNKNVKLFVVYQNRFNETATLVYDAYRDGRFGKIFMINASVLWYRDQDYYDSRFSSWHGIKNIDGGAFYTQASHYVDFMTWLANSDVKSVYSNLKTVARNIETEDVGIASIEWQNGIIGSINVTVLAYPENLEGSVTIIGEKGTVKIGGVALNNIECWKFMDKRPIDTEVPLRNYEVDSVYGFGHIHYYKDVINVLRGNKVSNIGALVDGDEGLKSLRILDAIYKSSATRSIKLFTQK